MEYVNKICIKSRRRNHDVDVQPFLLDPTGQRSFRSEHDQSRIRKMRSTTNQQNEVGSARSQISHTTIPAAVSSLPHPSVRRHLQGLWHACARIYEPVCKYACGYACVCVCESRVFRWSDSESVARQWGETVGGEKSVANSILT